jgi:hypothetical protein
MKLVNLASFIFLKLLLNNIYSLYIQYILWYNVINQVSNIKKRSVGNGQIAKITQFLVSEAI